MPSADVVNAVRYMVGLVALVTCAVASVAAAGPSIVGTETNPELIDPPDDVEYHPAHAGPQDRNYVDALAAWFEYDPAADSVNLTLKLATTMALDDPPLDWKIHYWFTAAGYIDGDDIGEFRFEWIKDAGGQESRVVAVGPGGQDLPAHVEMVVGEPGYITFVLEDRAHLRNIVEEIGDLSLLSQTHWQPVSGATSLDAAFDRGASDERYSLVGLEPVSSPDEPDDLPGRDAKPTGTPPPNEAVHVALLSVAGCIAGAAWLRRRRQ